MKLTKLALIAAIACGTYAGNVFADQTNDIQLVSCEANCDCGEPVCGCEPACDDATAMHATAMHATEDVIPRAAELILVTAGCATEF